MDDGLFDHCSCCAHSRRSGCGGDECPCSIEMHPTHVLTRVVTRAHTFPMTQTSTPAAIDYTAIFATWTDDMVTSSRNTTAVRDNNGNLRDMTAAEIAFCKAINAEWRRRFDRP